MNCKGNAIGSGGIPLFCFQLSKGIRRITNRIGKLTVYGNGDSC